MKRKKQNEKTYFIKHNGVCRVIPERLLKDMIFKKETKLALEANIKCR